MDLVIKALDTVDRPLLFRTLADLGLAPVVRPLAEAIHTTRYGDIPLIVALQLKGELDKGVWWAHSFSTMFNIALDYLCGRSLNSADRDSFLIDHVAYADDLVLIAYDEKTMHSKLQNLNNEIRKFGMEIEAKKTKCLIVGGNTSLPLSECKLPDGPKEQVNSFNYLA